MADRKTNRIRIDAILNAIRKGEYDDKLADIRESVNARLEHKRQEVLVLVQEVYGEGFTVVSKRARGASPVTFASGGGVVRSAAPGPQSVSETAIELSGEELEGPVEVPLVEGGGEEIESHSPIIGPYNPE